MNTWLIQETLFTVTNRSRITIGTSDGTLTISSVTAADAGAYRCAYEVSDGVYLYTSPATLSVSSGTYIPECDYTITFIIIMKSKIMVNRLTIVYCIV